MESQAEISISEAGAKIQVAKHCMLGDGTAWKYKKLIVI